MLLIIYLLKARRTAKNKIRYLLRNPFPKNDVNRTAKTTNRKSYGVSADVFLVSATKLIFYKEAKFYT